MFNSSKLILSTRPFTGFNVNNPKLNIEYFNRFQDSQQIKSVIGQAANHNIQAIMTLGEAELMPHLVEAYKQRGTTIYPIIPNMSSYVREVCDYGIVGAGIHRLKRLGLVNLIRMGLYNCSKALKILQRDFNTALSILFDVEMAEFRKFSPPAVFLHPQVTDLSIATNNKQLLEKFENVIRNRYKATPGVMTYNLGTLIPKLRAWEIPIKLISAPFNKSGFVMNPDQATCEKLIMENDFTLIADRISGDATLSEDSFRYLKKHGVESAVLDTVEESEMALAKRVFSNS